MRITIEETGGMPELEGLSSSVNNHRVEDFDDLVELFRCAALGLGYTPETVDTLETTGEILARISELESVNATLREELESVLKGQNREQN